MTNEERIVRLEQSFVILTQLARSADERMDTHQSWINDLAAAQANSEAKIAALTDAQIQSESRMNELRAAQANSDAKIAALADAQARTESSMDELRGAQANSEARIAALADAQIKTEEALVKLAEAHTKLAESQAHTDQRLDALIDVVRELRNGKS
jgi:chromosome segregation ATPase